MTDHLALALALRLTTLASTGVLVLLIVAWALAQGLPGGDQLLYLTQPDINNRARLILHDLRHDTHLPLPVELIGWGLDATWSPDGQAVAFTTFQPDAVRRDSPSWSPDGRYLAYQAIDSAAATGWDIYIHDLHTDTFEAVYVTPGMDGLPAWSPDGERLAFVGLDAASETYAILLLDVASGELTPLLGLAEAGFNVPLAWSPDGAALVFSAPLAFRNVNLYRIEIASGEMRQLTSGSSSPTEPDWSPGGERLAFTSYHPQGTDLRIYTMDASGGSMTLITPGTAGYRQPAWRP
ncbi:MAG: hypothetical protein ACOCZH_03210 [Phototrophicaceae bacterium]